MRAGGKRIERSERVSLMNNREKEDGVKEEKGKRMSETFLQGENDADRERSSREEERGMAKKRAFVVEEDLKIE